MARGASSGRLSAPLFLSSTGGSPPQAPAVHRRRSPSTSPGACSPPTARRCRGSTGSGSNWPGGASSTPTGSPVCPRARLRGTDTRQAIEHCGGSLVGQGQLFAQVFVPNQAPFGVQRPPHAFNGRTKAGRQAVLVHAYATDPPVSFVIPFSVHRTAGAFRTVLVALIRRSAGPWPHVANFQISVVAQLHLRRQAAQLPERLLPGAAAASPPASSPSPAPPTPSRAASS